MPRVRSCRFRPSPQRISSSGPGPAVGSPLSVSAVHFGRSVTQTAGRAIVVIDVLRATTAIACALAHGAREIIPVSDAGRAREIARSIDGALLGGEEDNQRIAGFDFGNSPPEYDQRVRGKTIVLRTTNGTRVLQAFAGARPVWCASFANLSSVVRALSSPAIKGVTFVCAGQEQTFSLEDFACAGAIIGALGTVRDTTCDDEAIAARELFAGHGENAAALLEMGNHAQALHRAGFGRDVAFAAQIDRHDVLPSLEAGRISASSPD